MQSDPDFPYTVMRVMYFDRATKNSVWRQLRNPPSDESILEVTIAYDDYRSNPELWWNVRPLASWGTRHPRIGDRVSLSMSRGSYVQFGYKYP